MNDKLPINNIIQGNCIEVLKDFPDKSINTIYFDPPFFTQKTHSSMNKERNIKYSFDDKYESLDEYLKCIKACLVECNRILKMDGCVFLHCDKTASHYLRCLLDEIFGPMNFINEIIWTYKRWSNSSKGLLNTHQVIFFYGKSKNYKFNTLYTDYSPTTNIDQILQERSRDEFGKSIYKKDTDGNTVKSSNKKGVPLSDVWEIPFLNPKAKERTGYPTQKPVALLEKIIRISSDENDIILDPFCGSGTTCVAAKHLNRKYIGIDISSDAVNLTKSRLDSMIITDSNLLKKGKKAYSVKTEREIALLNEINALPVQRNKLVDGFIKESLTPVIIQKSEDTVDLIIQKINSLRSKQGKDSVVLIQTHQIDNEEILTKIKDLKIVKTLNIQL